VEAKATTHLCPKCGSYSGETFEVIEEGSQPPYTERLRCKCGWEGMWSECKKEVAL
jgi:predicted RNA-binding Zn-ribbon protein involved in translation (DUF1610 family)